ncbi:MAG TPA: hypothetical protein VF883_15945 [Thermoanaerobaculia bacterium]|jgi:uncharacterized repeat protein (TIGR01451 family)
MKFRALLLLLFACLLAPLAAAQTADLRVDKSGPIEAAAGTNVTYTVTLTNLGPDAASTVLLTDPIPAGMTFVSATNDGGFSCSTPPAGDGGTINCTAASLAASGVVTFTFVLQLPVDAPAGTIFQNSATGSAQTPDGTVGNNTGSTSLAVAGETDLLVQKSGPAEAAAGSNVTYTVTLTNLGPNDAAGVLLVDPIPPGMTFVSQSNDGGFTCDAPAVGEGGTIDCGAESLAAGGVVTFTFVLQLPAEASPGTTFVNSATASTESIDVNEENNTGTASTATPPPPQADLSVTKSGPDASGPDSDVTFTIVLTNSGPAAATTVVLEDILPSGVTFVSLTNSNPAALACSTPPVGAGGTVTCNAATFAAGASVTLMLTVHLPDTSPATYTNSATVVSDNDPQDENDVSTTTLTVSSVDVSVDKAGPAVATAGTNVAYTLTVTNAGPEAALNVGLSDPLPPGTSFVSLVHNSGPVASCSTSGGNVMCTYGLLAPASSSQYTLTLLIGNATTINNTARVITSSFDTDATNDTDTVVTTVTQSADLAVTKTAPPAAVAGTNVTYNVSVTNNGPSNATNVSLVDTLPANSTFVSTTQNSGPTFACGHAAGTITCTIATLNVGATATFTFVVTANANATGTLANSVTVSATTPDATPGNNTSATTTTLSSSADVRVTKNAPAAAVTTSNVTFAITVTNAGPSSAVNVSLTDVLAPTLTFVSIAQTGGPAFTCGQAAGTVTCTIAALAPAAPATFDLVATTTVEGPISNTANVTSATPDPVPANNSSTTATNVTRQVADLSIAKTANATEFVPGAPAVYTLAVTNNGPGPASNVVVTDILPAGTTLLSATTTQGSCSGSATVTCTLGTLSALATATIALEVRLPLTPGPVMNSATVTSSDADPTPANNAATAIITVTAAPAGIPTLSPLMMLMLALSLATIFILRTR